MSAILNRTLLLAVAIAQELRESANIAWDKSINLFSIDVGLGDVKVEGIIVQNK